MTSILKGKQGVLTTTQHQLLPYSIGRYENLIQERKLKH